MRFHNFAYLLRQGARNVLRNRLMSFACIGVLVACMLLIGGAAMISLNVNAMIRFVEDQNEVMVFLEDTITDADIALMDLSLSGFDNIARFTFVSKAEVLQRQKELAGPEDAPMFDFPEEDNPFPNTYIVQIRDLARIEDTVARLRGLEGVEKVNASTEVAEILVAVRQAVAASGAGVVFILIAVSIVIITNNIKLTIFSRRKEINIMKYVGATDVFIRMPFLVEGMLIGLISAILAFLALGFGYTYLLQWIGDKFGGFLGPVFDKAIDFWSISNYIFGAFAALGIVIGAVGSGIFVRKHLKV